MEPAQINTAELKKLEVFQLKALRKILRRKTTFVARENTNAKVYREANQKLAELQENVKNNTNNKEIVTFQQAYKKARRKIMV